MTYPIGVAEVICQRIAEGESLREICREAEMPGKSTVMRWLVNSEAFRDQYARARIAQADHMAEEILEIADDGTNDYCVREGRDGEETEVVDHDHIARSRLRVDTRKWLMSKMAPKKYGDKVELEHMGNVKVTHIVRTIVYPNAESRRGEPREVEDRYGSRGPRTGKPEAPTGELISGNAAPVNSGIVYPKEPQT